MPESEEGAGIHAGHLETSLMLHLEPDLVAMDVARRDVPTALQQNRHVRFGGSVTFGWMSDDFSASGVIGDPTGATAEAGRVAFDHLVAEVVAALGEIAAMTRGRDPTPDRSLTAAPPK
jgi:creatinine amidohydrolase